MNTCTLMARLVSSEQVGPSLPALRIRTRTRKYTSRETVLAGPDRQITKCGLVLLDRPANRNLVGFTTGDQDTNNNRKVSLPDDRQMTPQYSLVENEELLERDSHLLQVVYDHKLSSFTFDGLRRLVGTHQETLSRSLRRLEEGGFIRRTDSGYVLQRDSMGVRSEGWSSWLRIPVLSMVLPLNFDQEQILRLLRGRWFGELRWLGHTAQDGEFVLHWVSNDGKVGVDAGLSRGKLQIDALIKPGAMMETAIRDAYSLVQMLALEARKATGSTWVS
jgi:hypothetical protein